MIRSLVIAHFINQHHASVFTVETVTDAVSELCEGLRYEMTDREFDDYCERRVEKFCADFNIKE